MAAQLSMKAAPHWLKVFQQRQVAAVIKGPNAPFFLTRYIHFPSVTVSPGGTKGYFMTKGCSCWSSLTAQAIDPFGTCVPLPTMTSSNENIFRVIGPLCGEYTGHRWISLTNAIDADLWCLLWSAPEQMVEKTIETPVIWDAVVLIMTSP